MQFLGLCASVKEQTWDLPRLLLANLFSACAPRAVSLPENGGKKICIAAKTIWWPEQVLHAPASCSFQAFADLQTWVYKTICRIMRITKFSVDVIQPGHGILHQTFAVFTVKSTTILQWGGICYYLVFSNLLPNIYLKDAFKIRNNWYFWK